MNGITMWRPVPRSFPGEPGHNQKTCTNRANRASRIVTAKLRVNNGEARADHRSWSNHRSSPDDQAEPRRSDGGGQAGCGRRSKNKHARKSITAGASVESTV